jgi:hypothetical protein
MSGKCMIAQGTDGMSCRSLSEDIMRGMGSKLMSDFLAFHLSALERDRPWLGKDCKVLTLEG